jgi:hypothetical protein
MLHQPKGAILTIISVALGMGVSSSILAAGAMPQSLSAENPESSPAAIPPPPPPPPPNGSPTGRGPAGTRGPCEETALPFTPLLPVSDSGFLGTTLASHPSFWFYIPYSSAQTSTGRFLLVNQDGTEAIYRADVALPDTPGFVQVIIPDTAPSLAINSSYRWQFMLYCGEQDTISPDFVFHQGSIQRIDESALTAPIATGSLTQQVRGLVQNQVWYDSTTDLEAIYATPNLWLELLIALELSYIEESENFSPTFGTVAPTIP